LTMLSWDAVTGATGWTITELSAGGACRGSIAYEVE